MPQSVVRKVRVEGNEIAFNIEPYMVGDKRKGYLVHGSQKWNPFRISTMTKADEIISGIARLNLPKVSVTPVPVSPGKKPKKPAGKRRKLNDGERERIKDRAAAAGETMPGNRGAIPDDLWDKFNDEAWMASRDAD